MTIEQHVGALAAQPVSVTRLARTTRGAIRLVTVLLPGVIAWLSFRDVPIDSIVDVLTRSNEVIWKAAVFIYFVSLILGANSDINDQELVYRVAPHDGRLPIAAGAIIALLALAGVVLANAGKFEHFAVSLAVFWIIFYIGWMYMVRTITGPMNMASRDTYAKLEQFVSLEKTFVVEHFLSGRWQVVRFAMGGAIIAIFLGLAAARMRQVNSLLMLGDVNWGAVKSLGMLFFVLSMESWMWAKRLKMKAMLMGLDELSRRYRFLPITESSTA